MKDYIVRATAANGQIRAFAATTRELVEEARSYHNTSPVATAALGRLLTGAGMMGIMMKGEKDLLTIRVNGDGPMKGLMVTADSKANVKGYVFNPQYINEPNYLGKLDVGGAIGYGTLNVIKDMGLKEPYVGQTALVTGEIAEDLTYYFATSEQVPTSVALGVLMNKNNTVRQAGGFIIQLMPFTEESVISELEKKIGEIKSITDMLEQGMTPENILEYILGDMKLEILDKVSTQYHCDCSKDRVSKAIASINKNDIKEMVEAGEDIEVNCQFCANSYKITVDELKKMLKS